MALSQDLERQSELLEARRASTRQEETAVETGADTEEEAEGSEEAVGTEETRETGRAGLAARLIPSAPKPTPTGIVKFLVMGYLRWLVLGAFLTIGLPLILVIFLSLYKFSSSPSSGGTTPATQKSVAAGYANK